MSKRKLRTKVAIAASATGFIMSLNAVLSAQVTVSSVGIMDPNPNALPLTDAPTNTSDPNGNGITLAAFQNLMTGSTLNTATPSTSSAFFNNAGGVLDFQEQYQGGSFPNQAGANNGVTIGSGSAAPITAQYGTTETGSFSFYRAPGVTAGDGIDANTNQGANVISGGYASDTPPNAPTGGATGLVDYTVTPPSTTDGLGAAQGAGYMGITGDATPCTLVFNSGLAAFGITAVIRGSSRDSQLVASVINSVSLAPVTTITTSDVLVTSTCTFFGIQLTSAQLAAGDVISQVVIQSISTLNQNRYDDMALIAPAVTWDNAGGAGNGTAWDISGNANWSYFSAPGAAVNIGNTPVIFNDTNNGHYAVTLNTAVTPTDVTVNNSSGNYTISGTGGIGGTGVLVKEGTSSLTLSTVNTYTGGTIINGGTVIAGVANSLPSGGAVTINSGVLQLGKNSGVETLSALTIAAGSTFDINNDHVFINYPGTSPGPGYLTLLKASHSAGWTGTGIISTQASTTAGYGIAYGDGGDPHVTWLSSGQIEMSYTLYGDINQDGSVNGTDFGILASNFGKSVTGGWEQGDLNYDGAVTGADFALLASNFGKSASGRSVDLPASQWAALDSFAAANGLLADVPEPTSIGLLTLSGLSLLARQRRSRKN